MEILVIGLRNPRYVDFLYPVYRPDVGFYRVSMSDPPNNVDLLKRRLKEKEMEQLKKGVDIESKQQESWRNPFFCVHFLSSAFFFAL